jgi:hypothetical protein
LKAGKSQLRGGVARVASGNLVLNENLDIGGVSIFTLGSGDDYMRPLFNASVDTYYSYK